MGVWLGPVENPVELRWCEPQVDAPMERAVSERVSLSGRRSAVVYGRSRKRWSLSWPFMDDDEARGLLSLLNGDLGEYPWFFYDPSVRNWFPPDVAVPRPGLWPGLLGNYRVDVLGTSLWEFPGEQPVGFALQADGDVSTDDKGAVTEWLAVPSGWQVEVSAPVWRVSSGQSSVWLQTAHTPPSVDASVFGHVTHTGYDVASASIVSSGWVRVVLYGGTRFSQLSMGVAPPGGTVGDHGFEPGSGHRMVVPDLSQVGRVIELVQAGSSLQSFSLDLLEVG